MADDELETAFTVAVKWGKEVYTVNLPQQATLGDLKRDLEMQTQVHCKTMGYRLSSALSLTVCQVLVKKQKLLGIPRKAGDETPFANLKIKVQHTLEHPACFVAHVTIRSPLFSSSSSHSLVRNS